jgi:hypothetical protein
MCLTHMRSSLYNNFSLEEIIPNLSVLPNNLPISNNIKRASFPNAFYTSHTMSHGL